MLFALFRKAEIKMLNLWKIFSIVSYKPADIKAILKSSHFHYIR